MCSARFVAPLTALFLAVLASQALAQGVAPGVFLDRPAPTAATDLSHLGDGDSKVAIVHSARTADVVGGGAERVAHAVRNWEYLFLGLGVRYELFEDDDLEHPIPDRIRILVLPAVESLSAEARRRLEAYVLEGGGLLLSGRTGYYDESGARTGAAFLESVSNARLVEDLPAQPYGLVQVLHAESPLAAGIEPGYRLNIAALTQLSAMSPRQAPSGSIEPFAEADRAAFDGLTLIHAGTRGRGRYLWTRFLPQDVSRTAEAQQGYQTLIVNAMAWMFPSASISVASWPEVRSAALVVAALPTPGYDPLSFYANVLQLLDELDELDVKADFHLSADELDVFPDLSARIAESGHVVSRDPADESESAVRSPEETSATPSMPGSGVGTGVFIEARLGADAVSRWQRLQTTGGAATLGVRAESFLRQSAEGEALREILLRARAENAWITTPDAVAAWTLALRHVSPEIAFSGPDELHIDVTNSSNEPVMGLGLEVRIPGIDPERVRVDDPVGLRTVATGAESVTLVVPELPRGTMRIVLAWER